MKRRGCLVALLSVAALLLLLDFVLWRIDPGGVVRYFWDWLALTELAIPAPDGIRYTPGQHHFHIYTATIGIDGLRIVPDGKISDCRIVFVGDSVTFGMGANDFDTFPNLLAQSLPAAVANAAFPAYSAENVELSIRQHPANGYIWLIIQNDDGQPYRWKLGGGSMSSATNLYVEWARLTQMAVQEPLMDERFIAYADRILARKDVLVFVFEDERLTDMVQQRYPDVVTIPRYTGRVSPFDPHPDAEGHRQIAVAMLEPVQAFVGTRCP